MRGGLLKKKGKCQIPRHAKEPDQKVNRLQAAERVSLKSGTGKDDGRQETKRGNEEKV